MSEDLIKRSDAIKAIDELPNAYNGWSDAYDKTYIISTLEEVPKTDRPQGEWIKMPHKEYLSWDCVGEYENPTYDEKYHSVVEWWWHCNKCFYEMSRDEKPSYNFCPNCGADMRG